MRAAIVILLAACGGSPMMATCPPFEVPAPAAPLTTDASIARFSVNQAVEIALTDGAGVESDRRLAPVVAGRPGLARVYVALEPGVTSIELTAELWLGGDCRPMRHYLDRKTISRDSTAADLDSTLNVELPADAIGAGTRYRLALTSNTPQIGSPYRAKLPRSDESAPLGALDTGGLSVRIVPIRYDADGSARIPDLSPARIGRLHDELFRLMPLARVEIELHEPVPFGETVTMSTFDRLLAFVTQLRDDERPSSNVYYYGLVQPTDDERQLCAMGCTEGIANLPHTATSVGDRAAIGVSYGDDVTSYVFAHELGHSLGLSHAPCGFPAGPDSRFPQPDGTLGTWGYDLVAKTLVEPTKAYDVMTYCHPSFISGFHYALLGDRLAANARLDEGAPASP